ncbi:MAG: UDP-N-acetylglucosamine--LPS N-acetylglucosamine transferase [Rubrivivax sp.]|nr:MAG: UDP-N-acetylglucosamine--LPS N-acetylglucosamine transferase [Rubrivivax sp.]
MDRPTRVMAVASGGGHWIQLRRLVPAMHDASVEWVSTKADYAKDLGGQHLHVVKDANQWDKLGLIKLFVQVAWLVLRHRPEVIITTGAAPGFAAIMFGRWLGARTIWIDSIANSEELSGSGARAGRWAHVWLTQWEHLSRPEGPHYWGAVL